MSSSSETNGTSNNNHQKDSFDLTPEKAVSIVSKFFPNEWPSTDVKNVQLTRLRGGWVNKVYIVERTFSDKNSSEPLKLLLKMYGGNLASEFDSQEGVELTLPEELLVCLEWSKTGLGPKLLGVFPEGRVEEYIESSMMTREDCLSNDRVRKDFAKCLARFHSLEMPFMREPYDFVEVLSRMAWNFRNNVEQGFRKNEKLKQNVDSKRIADYDYESLLEYLTGLMSPQFHRKVFIHWDTHMQNVLVRKNPLETESSVMLVDLQEACYNFRGKDLGLHLASMMVDFTNPTSEVDEFPHENYYTKLFQEYLDHVKQLGFIQEFDERDTVDHLLFESLVGSIVSILYFLLGFANLHEIYVNTAPEFTHGLTALFNCMLKCKEKLDLEFPKGTPH